jgi:hypothetical protein
LIKKTIHIISFDVPYPANYGGIIDVYYKLQALFNQGVDVIFHAFTYDGHNAPHEHLNYLCKEVHYYRRSANPTNWFMSGKPFIVSSRANKSLLDRLMKDDYPILFEGLHTTNFIRHHKLKDRQKIVRTHNIEHDYYNGLKRGERNFIKRIYFSLEAKRLAKYESVLSRADLILSIAQHEVAHFNAYAQTVYVPPFFNQDVDSIKVQEEGEKFVLYHGNLSVNENATAVNYILTEIAPLTSSKICIAGHAPSQEIVEKASRCENVRLIVSPDDEELQQLIIHAHIHLLLTFQQTGIKLKLLNALQKGKFVIINKEMNDAGMFNESCVVANSKEEILSAVQDNMNREFNDQLLAERKAFMQSHFDNEQNAKKIIELL